MMTKEGHNITVLHRMIKNIFIRWDKDYDHKVHCFSNEDLDEKAKEKEDVGATKSKRFQFSQIIIHDAEGDNTIKIDVPRDTMETKY